MHLRLDEGARSTYRSGALSEIIRGRDPAAGERATIDGQRAAALAHDPAQAERGALLRRPAPALRRARRALRADLRPSDDERPIHNDYNQFNYLFRPARPPLILDWEGAIGAPREYEVVRCLNHLPLVAPAQARRFLDGYLERRRLRPRAAARGRSTRRSTDHALKHWRLEGWLRGDPGADPHFAATRQMVRMLTSERAGLDGFFAQVAGAPTDGRVDEPGAGPRLSTAARAKLPARRRPPPDPLARGARRRSLQPDLRGVLLAVAPVAALVGPASALARDLSVAARVLAPRVFKLVGGEPLLHPELVELVEVARRAAIAPRISLTTNGLLLPRMSEPFWRGLDAVTISLYPRPRWRGR